MKLRLLFLSTLLTLSAFGSDEKKQINPKVIEVKESIQEKEQEDSYQERARISAERIAYWNTDEGSLATMSMLSWPTIIGSAVISPYIAYGLTLLHAAGWFYFTGATFNCCKKNKDKKD